MTEEIQQIQLDTKPEAIANLRRQEWYIHFIQELETTKTNGEYNARWELVKMYHAIGKNIAEQLEDFSRAQIYGSKIYEAIAEDINKSKETVFKAVQFYKKYPNAIEDASSLPESKNISWSKLVKKYLPEPKQHIEQSKENVSGKIDKESLITPPARVNNSNKLDISIYNIKDYLDLFLELRSSSSSTDQQVISSTIAKHLLKKFTASDITDAINIYSKEKSPGQITLLIEIETNLNSLRDNGNHDTPPLFENDLSFQPPKTSTVKSKSLSKPTPIREFISQYSQLYVKKFSRPPVTGPKSYASLGKLLKTKIEQDYSFEEILAMLQIYSQPENSNFCGFALFPFFSDNVFNKMLALLSKKSSQTQEGKYREYEN